MLGILIRPRLPLTKLVALPRNLSAWLLAGALFFTAIPDFIPELPIPIFILLFLAAVGVGAIERVHKDEAWAGPDLRWIGALYGLAFFLLAAVYVVNGLYDLLFGSPGPSHQLTASHYRLTDKALAYFADDMGPQEIPFLKLMAGVVLMPLVTLLVRIRSWAEFRFVLLVGTAGSLFGALFTIAYCNGFIPSHDEYFWTHLRRAQGLNPHPNVLGMNTFLGMPGLCILLVECRNRAVQLGAMGGIAALWWAIDYSGSRVSLGGLLIMLALMFVLFQPGLKKQIQTAFLVGVISIASLTAISSLVQLMDLNSNSAISRFFNNRAVASDSVRSTINEAVMDDIWASPVFGSGYEVILLAHNVFLQMLHAGGVFGFAGFMLTLLIPVWLLYRLPYRLPYGNAAAADAVPIVLSAVATLIIMNVSQSNPSYFSVSLFLSMAVYAGLAARADGRFSPLLPPPGPQTPASSTASAAADDAAAIVGSR